MTPTAGGPAPRRDGDASRPTHASAATPGDAVIVPIGAARPGAGGPTRGAGVAAAKVERLLATISGTTSLHRRSVPGTTALVDHVVVAPAGVLVVVTDSCRGPITVSRAVLEVDGLDRTDLVVGVEQLAGAIAAVADDVPVETHVCIVDGDFVESGPKRCRATEVSGIAGLRRRIEVMRIVGPGTAAIAVAPTSTRLDARLHPVA